MSRFSTMIFYFVLFEHESKKKPIDDDEELVSKPMPLGMPPIPVPATPSHTQNTSIGGLGIALAVTAHLKGAALVGQPQPAHFAEVRRKPALLSCLPVA